MLFVGKKKKCNSCKTEIKGKLLTTGGFLLAFLFFLGRIQKGLTSILSLFIFVYIAPRA